MPNIIVLFELKPTPEGRARYLELAAMLNPLADHSKLLSMNVWTDEAAVSRWRNTLKHRLAQKEGRDKLIESYRVTVCAELRSYTEKDRKEAPDDSNRYFTDGN